MAEKKSPGKKVPVKPTPRKKKPLASQTNRKKIAKKEPVNPPEKDKEEKGYIKELQKSEKTVPAKGTSELTSSSQKTGLSASKKDSKAVKPAEEEEPIDPEAAERGDKPMSVVGHLHELRSRLLLSLMAIVVLTVASFIFSDFLFNFISKPFSNVGHKLNQFNILEGFTIRLKTSFLIGVLASLPLLIYQVWKYILPAINREDRMFMRIIFFSAILLFYTGIITTYIFLPMAITTMLSFTPESIVTTINATQYFNFVVFFSLSMGVIFELPIMILILTKLGIITPSFLIQKRKHAIVIIWVVAAFVTPTSDPLTLSMVAVPLMILFEISIIISKFIVIRRKKRELEGSQ